LLGNVFGYCPRALCDKQKVLPVGLSDTLKTSRFKVFCPRCEEVYLPKFRNINIDGAYFGTSFPHAFLKHYPEAIILPPKVFFYEPKIFGFKIAGKRGSKLFTPPQGTIKYIEESMNYVEREKLYKELKETNKENTAGQNVVPSPAKASQKSPQKASEGGQTGRGRQQKAQNIAVTQSQ
jgi:casein kinase II subunit beta